MTPKPPKGIATRRDERSDADHLSFMRRGAAGELFNVGEFMQQALRWVLVERESLLGALAQANIERDSYREQVKALLKRIGEVQRCDHGGET